MIELTQSDSDLLSDIIWWIKGRASTKHESGDYHDLDGSHVEALRRARIFAEEMNEHIKQLVERAEKAEKLAEEREQQLLKYASYKSVKAVIQDPNDPD